jgi:hypothetical protein
MLKELKRRKRNNLCKIAQIKVKDSGRLNDLEPWERIKVVYGLNDFAGLPRLYVTVLL